jgi:hypothetical protein
VLLDNVSHINAQREPRRFPGVGSTLLFGSRRLLNRANSDLIGVTDWPYVVFRQGDDRLRVSRCSYELDLESVG